MPDARLLAATLGAPTRPGIGGPPCVAPVYLTEDGCVDRVLGAAPTPLDVLQRDLDTFDLPPGATALATSAVDPAPAFRLSRAYGLPFHLEVDAELAACSADGPPGYPTSASLRAGVAVFDAFARMALVPRTLSRRPPTSRRTP
jgi:GMP synthase-like glutamine amidotransferase